MADIKKTLEKLAMQAGATTTPNGRQSNGSNPERTRAPRRSR